MFNIVNRKGNINQTTIKYCFKPARMNLIFKKINNCDLGEDIETLEPSFNLGRNVKGCTLCGKQFGIASKMLKIVITWYSTSKHMSMRNENLWSQKNLHKNAQNCIIQKSQWVDTIQMSINWWMCKQNVGYLSDGILFSHKKERSTDTCYRVVKLWKYCAKRRKSFPKNHTSK